MFATERRRSPEAILPLALTVALVLGCASPVLAADTVDATLKVGEGVGVSFGALSETSQTLTINLIAPDDWVILESAPRNDGGSGELIWQPHGGIAGAAKTHTYTLTGIVPEDGYAVGFNGKLTIQGEEGGDPPDFDAAVADLDVDLPGVADSDEDEEPYGGLFLPVLYENDQQEFSDAPNDDCIDLSVHLRPKWAGPPISPTTLGTLTFDLEGIGKAGVAIYKPDGTRLTGDVSIAPGDLDGNGEYNKTYKILTNTAFEGIVTIEATFEWDDSLAAPYDGYTDTTGYSIANDRVRIVRIYDFPDCYVDLDTDSDNSGSLDRDNDEEELEYTAPGKYLTYMEGCSRVAVALDVLPTNFPEGVTGRLSLPDNQAGLTVWGSATGDDIISVDEYAEWDLHTEILPTRVWVEPSQAGESHLRFAIYGGEEPLAEQTLIFTGLAGAIEMSGWDSWYEVDMKSKTDEEGKRVDGGTRAPADLKWTAIGGGVMRTPIPPPSPYIKEGNYFRTEWMNFPRFEGSGIVTMGVEIYVEWKIGDTNSARPNPEGAKEPPAETKTKHDCFQYYGNSGVYIFNQYEVQIIDANNYSMPNGGIVAANGEKLQIADPPKSLQWWREKFENKATTIEELLFDGRNIKAPILVSQSIPGGAYLQAPPTGKWKNLTVATLPINDNWDTKNTLRIHFWPADNTNEKAYMRTWVNGTGDEHLVMDQEVEPTSKSKWDGRIQKEGGIYLQSHWGSNVKFRAPTIKGLTAARP